MRCNKIAIVIGLALMLSATLAIAADGAPKQDTDQLKKLSAQLWQQVLSIPTSVNPLVDPTGGNCMVGQDGSVWFLVGAFSSGTYNRSCSIPEGVSLYFPVVDYVSYNTPNVCGQGPQNISVEDQRAYAKKVVDGATALSVEVDGNPVKKLSRVQSDVFAVAQPADNVFLAPCGGDSPAGIYSPGIDDGYYVLLKPLPVGEHTLHFTAMLPLPFSLDVTYHLTVVPVLTK